MPSRRRLALAPAAAAMLATAAPAVAAQPAWLSGARILVPSDPSNLDCRTAVCRHNENTDLHRWRRAIWFVHRTAGSQVLGPNSSLRVYRSGDGGRSFALQAVIPAPPDRDIRDPHFFEVGRRLHIKAITRLPGFALRDKDAGSISVDVESADGRRWTTPRPIGPLGWGFWRVLRLGGRWYSAAYEDGDLRVRLFGSTNGRTWRPGATIYDVAADTPLETELVPTPSRRGMLALVRMDGTDYELFGNRGRLRTKVCWARRPYRRFDCPQELRGVRLDGPVAFRDRERLFVIARKHLRGPEVRKRTGLYELTGDQERGPLAITEHGELPSAGDTSYAGVARIGASRWLTTWYSSPPAEDPSWIVGFAGPTNIWRAVVDASRIPRPRRGGVPVTMVG